MQALILKIFEYFSSSSKKIPSLVLSKIRLLGKDCISLTQYIRQEDISIKRLIFLLKSLPSCIIKDLKSMSRISSYISISVIGAIGLALLIIVTLDSVGSMIDGAGDVTKEYNFFQVLIYVALTMPGRIYEFLPTAALIGCLVGLGGLANNSELIVIRAAGVSILRIVWMVLRPILLLVLIGVMFGEYIVPHTEKYAESRRMLLTKGKVSQGSASGLWNKEGSEFTHIEAIFPGGELFGVTRYEFDDNHVLKKASFADKASFQNGTWVEEFGAATYFEANSTRVENFIQRIWATELSPELLNIASLPSESLSMRDLSKHSSYLNDQGQNASRYELDFWRKALQPFTIVGLILIASSFIFGPLRRVSMGYRIFAGVVVGIVFRISQDLLGPASIVFGFSPFIAVIFPAIICSLIGISLLRRSS
jgi:lipopolysaccharide export system permease protein|tara:strand:+ start:26331 stop:27596 length:1266 start_codon:yes stop_codon:yes gene_type:complete